MSDDELAIARRALERERKARRAAEELLSRVTRRLSAANAMLRGRLSIRAGGRPSPKGATSGLSRGMGVILHITTAGRSVRG